LATAVKDGDTDRKGDKETDSNEDKGEHGLPLGVQSLSIAGVGYRETISKEGERALLCMFGSEHL
jgi:hypothetical protein